ncbi:L,D-transpeptidase family protein [Falsihalocynthiibacter arcticus]|uniref:L,D-TPase catalytic domain-containing protein n=1 Tax=Falsihalocynthiibacter arcticus TaxID=1579316 RepID=A0A126UZC5_9RHOB|nr:L,D-transpeptidase family protein [Falsihalocynthiibacter arcticus]AML50799.1 hypothetical protein RC74_05440 [Falsihalocynthiibacter arcticus]
MGRRIPCSIGKGGFVADKREGDGGTPRQEMRLVGGGFRQSRLRQPHVPFPMRAIGPADVWSDDSCDPDYNSQKTQRFYKFSHETLFRSDPLYDVVLYTDYNYPQATLGLGSAIFVHQWRKPRHPTEGCIAFSRQNLQWILARWTPYSRIIVKA